MSKQGKTEQQLRVKFGVSLPPQTVKELDQQSDIWQSSRSQAILRVFQEWKILVKNCGDQLPPSAYTESDDEQSGSN